MFLVSLGPRQDPALQLEDPAWQARGGMNGVHDQILALRWVKEHIGEFGTI